MPAQSTQRKCSARVACRLPLSVVARVAGWHHLKGDEMRRHISSASITPWVAVTLSLWLSVAAVAQLTPEGASGSGSAPGSVNDDAGAAAVAPSDTLTSVVRFVTAVHRHGDRSPVRFLPTSQTTSHWAEGTGMLTADGMQQLSQLGLAFRARYGWSGGLISENYTRRELVVRSTDYDRTLMSAQSFLAGLYPPGSGPLGQDGLPGLTRQRLQPVPIHTVPRSEDALLRGYARDGCEALTRSDAERDARPEWTEMREQHAQLLDALPSLSGLNHSSQLDRVFEVHDALVCDRAHSLPWPPGFTQSIFEELSEMSRFTLKEMFATYEQRRLSAGLFLGEVRERLLAAAASQPQPHWDPSSVTGGLSEPTPSDFVGPRLAMYSAHDTTVASVLSALGVFDGNNPPYGSSIVFELVESNIAGVDRSGPPDAADLFVRTFYNRGVDDPFENEISIPGCSAAASPVCTLDEFISATDGLVPENRELECQGDAAPLPDDGITAGQIVLILLFCCIGGLGIGLAAVFSWRWWHRRPRGLAQNPIFGHVQLEEIVEADANDAGLPAAGGAGRSTGYRDTGDASVVEGEARGTV